MRNNFSLVAFVFVFAFFCTTANSEIAELEQPSAEPQTRKAPIWELGLGLGTVIYPDYHGSDEYRFLPIPAPYFVHRGGLSYDEEGFQSRLFRNEYYVIGFSFGVGPPVKSKKNSARTDMKNLPPVMELGSDLTLTLAKAGHHSLELALPYRFAFSFNYLRDKPRNRGRVFDPAIKYRLKINGSYNNFRKLAIGAGPIYATKSFNQFYYGVKARDATASRPAYDADGGYSGYGVIGYFSSRQKSWWYATFVKYEGLKGAVYDDSPLVKTTDYWAVGLLCVYVFSHSDHEVEL